MVNFRAGFVIRISVNSGVRLEPGSCLGLGFRQSQGQDS